MVRICVKTRTLTSTVGGQPDKCIQNGLSTPCPLKGKEFPAPNGPQETRKTTFSSCYFHLYPFLGKETLLEIALVF